MRSPSNMIRLFVSVSINCWAVVARILKSCSGDTVFSPGWGDGSVITTYGWFLISYLVACPGFLKNCSTVVFWSSVLYMDFFLFKASC